MNKAKGFPIHSEATTVPWDFVLPHEAQAERNHWQTLDRLAHRGGLSWLELYAVITDRNFATIRHMTKDQAKTAVLEALKRFEEEQQIQDRRFKCLEEVLAHNSELCDIAREAWFLIERLEEFDPTDELQNVERDWHGHVAPPLARLKALIEKVNKSPTGKGFAI